jgi:protein translocase SecG subunit
MKTVYYIAIGLALAISVVFAVLVLITGKGDAMSGGGGVRTTFKGRATFDDIMSKITLYLGVSWMALMLLIDMISTRMASH